LNEEIRRIIRPEYSKKVQSDTWKNARDDKAIEEHVLFLEECWPSFGSEQLLIMLKIQRLDESIPLSAVTDVLGDKPSHEDIMESDRLGHNKMLQSRMAIKQKWKARNGTIGVSKSVNKWYVEYSYLGKRIQTSRSTKKEACDWYDKEERKHIPKDYQVLNNYEPKSKELP
jgi:hypothetical protein